MIPVNELGFDFAIYYEIPPRYGELNFVREVIRNTYNETTGLTDFSIVDTIVEKEYCGSNGFNYSN